MDFSDDFREVLRRKLLNQTAFSKLSLIYNKVTLNWTFVVITASLLSIKAIAWSLSQQLACCAFTKDTMGFLLFGVVDRRWGYTSYIL